MVDGDHIYRSLLRRQLQSKLLLYRGEEVVSVWHIRLQRSYADASGTYFFVFPAGFLAGDFTGGFGLATDFDLAAFDAGFATCFAAGFAVTIAFDLTATFAGGFTDALDAGFSADLTVGLEDGLEVDFCSTASAASTSA